MAKELVENNESNKKALKVVLFIGSSGLIRWEKPNKVGKIRNIIDTDCIFYTEILGSFL